MSPNATIENLCWKISVIWHIAIIHFNGWKPQMHMWNSWSHTIVMLLSRQTLGSQSHWICYCAATSFQTLGAWHNQFSELQQALSACACSSTNETIDYKNTAVHRHDAAQTAN